MAQAAVIMKNLMNRLGFNKYYVQGGDWGATIVSALSTLYPEEVLGHHTNMAVISVRIFIIYLKKSFRVMKSQIKNKYEKWAVTPLLLYSFVIEF